ncbi:MAG: hypothetical protein KAI26_07080 [Nanoarchaeota archaeon]|nr:hypothetical protein [Nanoarchaeota archaeon]
MRHKKRFSISGTLFTLILVYFIYLIAKDKEWKILSFITGAYLFIIIGFFALVILGILLLILIPLLFLKKPILVKRFKRKSVIKNPKANNNAIDVDFKVKD